MKRKWYNCKKGAFYVQENSLFSIATFFLITGFSHIENQNSPNPQDSSVFAGEILESGKKLYSQYDEELIIRYFFNDRKGGIFVDVGCAHYKEMSTTYYLEKHLGWRGIAVDSLAEFAIGYIQHRPNTRFFNFIVTDHSGDREPFYRLINVTGLSSTNENYTQQEAKYYRAQRMPGYICSDYHLNGTFEKKWHI